MRIGNKLYKNKTNIVEDKCPLCNKNLRFKPPCCSDKTLWLVCPCGYRRKA